MHKFPKILWAFFLIGSVQAAPQLNPRVPDVYVVQEGDTLWNIAHRYLKAPWQWPEVVKANAELEDPQFLYAGDVIAVRHATLKIKRGRPVVKLSPRVRTVPLPRPIPTLPMDAIAPFLSRPLVVGKGELRRAAYVVANSDRRLLSGLGDKIYVRGLESLDRRLFSVFRPGKALRDPDSRAVLGYEAVHVADGQLVGQKEDGVATLHILRMRDVIHPGDRVLPAEKEEAITAFVPHAPPMPVEGRIISVADNTSRIGLYQVVVINLGRDDGIMIGDVLAIYQRDIKVRDPLHRKKVQLPRERSGLLMVFRTFDRVSYGLVLQAVRDIHPLDKVGNPEG
ncbi:MAG: LysM domain-containing protein [Gammaproteobacteria bacterium]|nr:MAG: LysM domain-containing protein [Gammaproteobacteria bacterium]